MSCGKVIREREGACAGSSQGRVETEGAADQERDSGEAVRGQIRKGRGQLAGGDLVAVPRQGPRVEAFPGPVFAGCPLRAPVPPEGELPLQGPTRLP